MKSETPRTDAAFAASGISITGKGGFVTITDARQLERELNEMRKALDDLHVAIECSPGDVILDWYRTDPVASQARDNALAILTRRAGMI